MTSPAHAAGREGPMPAVLWALLFGNFVIGTGVMVVPGTLSEISDALGTPVAAAGFLISIAALVMCLGAPLLAAVVGGWDRRRLLAASMLWYGLLHLACAAAPGFSTLLPLRALAVLAPATFTPQAAACVGLLVRPAQRGRAITFIFLGWSVASVLGMPLGALIGGTLGWRAAFAVVGLLSMASAVWIWRAMPDGIRPPALSASAWVQTLRNPGLMMCVGVTALSSAGQFVLFSYFAPWARRALQAGPAAFSLWLACFGVFGLMGNLLMSRWIDRIGAARATLIALGCIALSLVFWPLATHLLAAAVVVTPWALGCFSSNSAQQARLVGIAPALAAGSVALNTSAMYAGQAVGAASGGWLIAADRWELLNWAALVGLLLAMALSILASRRNA